MKILLLLLILSLSGCLNSNNDSEQDKIKNLEEQRIITDTTEITVRIPSKVSGKKLEITLPRCMFGFSIKNKIIDGIVEQKAAAIIFALPTLSGFPNDEEAIHRCPDFSKPVVGLSFAPLYRNIKAEKLEYGNHWFKRENYRFRLKEKKNNQELYYIGISGKQTMFINKSETSQQDLRIDFWPFNVKDEYNAFPHQIDIYSVLDEEFSVAYTVYSSRFLHGKYKPPVSQNYFADGLIQIYKHNESLLDHPEIQLGFIQNNNRILDYIHQHSKVVTDQNH
ncbi:hypothetical protein BGI05_02780 [Snodgrassella alvi]|uniref:hypothetical protein n=1 Tax=Snodgrassella alvi TaxID=1196083 RepID=UPI0009FC2E0D|nr:hypothetical protein [Snodgrassella alvi]ORF04119.1 hypothetical protein BGH97_01315 [Snodgrassella alvi]ORF08482.1 hypothetical protein BGH99_05485 [Snodgrassella alvi]ORF13457.1 hypothetical protein BGI00_03860 [Snodgrassella alvi]ORF14779.1 hypothetical protein BGI02_04345 [Snodgrassella alvi]ORF22182.1 hypothetical protein BGI05_02780 [Snodgrassella alvi]